MSYTYKKFSVVIPFYNEEENVYSVCKEIQTVLEKDKIDFELICVNDSSKDNTAIELRKVKSILDNRLQIVDLQENMGQSFALFEGIKRAKNEIVVMIDGDGQYDPKDIEKLILLLKGSVRLVSGVRDNRNDPFFYKLASKFGNKIIARFFNMQQFDLGCGLKIAYKSDLLKIRYFRHMHRYFQIIYSLSDLQIDQAIINHRPRLKGKSKYSLLKIFNIIPRIIWLKYNKDRILK